MFRFRTSNLLIPAALILTALLIMTLGDAGLQRKSLLPDPQRAENNETPPFIQGLMDFFDYHMGDLLPEGKTVRKILFMAAVPLGLFALAMMVLMVLFSGSVRREFAARIAAIAILLGLLNMLFYSGLLPESEGREAGPEMELPLQESLPDAMEPFHAEPVKPHIPSFLPYSLSALVISLAFFFILRRFGRNEDGDEQEDLIDITAKALSSLDDGADYSEVILQCYSDMSMILKEKKDVERPVSATPEEFLTRLIREGLPPRETERLTVLFEKVRYGRRELTPSEETDARQSLEAIVRSLELL